MARNYKNEYQAYQGTEKQKKNRAMRNAARAKMIAAGKAAKYDGKDVNHKNGTPKDNSMKNLENISKKANRSYPRTAKAKKKNKYD